MIFRSYGRPTGSGLYITFKSNNEWSIPQYMGQEINKTGGEFCPMVDPDGKYFFFTSGYIVPKAESKQKLTYQNLKNEFQNSFMHPQMGRNDIYWVDIKIIDQFREIK